MIRPIIVANWKMHKTVSEALDFVHRLKQLIGAAEDRQIVIAPPFTALYPVGQALKDTAMELAAQNLNENSAGAFTGEISAGMLKELGCKYVIVGHSERRKLFGETNEVVGEKIGAAIRFGIRPIFCIGETLNEHEAGNTFAVVEKQIKEGLHHLDASAIGQLIIAYEPVWAIGTGKTATPGQAAEVHAHIRSLLGKNYGKTQTRELPVIYGGSVNADNIGALMSRKNIDGALVGGASLNAEAFGKIVSF